jgi:hypothetical protein
MSDMLYFVAAIQNISNRYPTDDSDCESTCSYPFYPRVSVANLPQARQAKAYRTMANEYQTGQPQFFGRTGRGGSDK